MLLESRTLYQFKRQHNRFAILDRGWKSRTANLEKPSAVARRKRRNLYWVIISVDLNQNVDCIQVAIWRKAK